MLTEWEELLQEPRENCKPRGKFGHLCFSSTDQCGRGNENLMADCVAVKAKGNRVWPSKHGALFSTSAFA